MKSRTKLILTLTLLLWNFILCTCIGDWEIQKSRLVYHFTASEAKNPPFYRRGKSIFPIAPPPRPSMDLKPQSSRLIPAYSPPLRKSPRDTLGQGRQYMQPRGVKNPIQPTSFSAALDVPKPYVQTPTFMRGQVLPAPSSGQMPQFHYRYHYHTPGMGESQPSPVAITNRPPVTPTAPPFRPPPTSTAPPYLPPVASTAPPYLPPVASTAPPYRPPPSTTTQRQLVTTATSTAPTTTEKPDPNLDGASDTNSGIFGARPTTQKPDESREIRFLIYKPGDEEIIKSAVIEDAKLQQEKVSFLEGPSLVLENREKIHLPKKKKTILYIMLKEPEIKTEVDLIEPEEKEDELEVFVIYQNKDKGVKQTHYKLDGGQIGPQKGISTPQTEDINEPHIGYNRRLRETSNTNEGMHFVSEELETSASSVKNNVVQFEKRVPACAPFRTQRKKS